MSHRQGRWILIGLLSVSLFAGAISLPVTQAAPPAQGRLSFDDPSGMSGTLSDASPTANWSFDCVADGVGSVVVTTTSGDLAVDIAVMDAAGTAFAGGSQVSSSPNVSAVEAFTMPSSGACGVQISRFSGTSGSYEVQLLPGFAHLEVWDQFDNSGSLGLSWSSYTSDTLLVDLVNQQLQIQVLTDNLLGYAIPDEETTWGDFYVQADVTIEGSPSYAEYGFVLRLTTAEDDSDDNFYSFYFSTDGDYTVYYFDGEWQLIQEWTTSSAVPEDDPQARLGIMFQGNVMRAYYDGQFVGEVTDTVGYSSEGTIALAIGTMQDQTDTLAVSFDNLVLTTPSKTGGSLPFGGTGATPQPTAAAGGLLGMLGAATKPPEATATTGFSFPTAPTATAGFTLPTAPPAVPTAPSFGSGFPASLANWNSAAMAEIVTELRQAGVVPSGGSLSLNVPSSYGDTSASGWSYYPLGQGNVFRNFVLSFDARQIFGDEGAGCGMFFRDTDTTSNDAIIFADGSALLAEWDSDGNLTDSSQLGAFEGVNGGVGATNRVIVVANEASVLMYVNGQLFANTQFTPRSGGVALELYVPTNDAGQTQETYCQLNNIWLWAF